MQGAGYLDEEINQNLGVAQTSSAAAGYGANDGSYTPLKQEKFQALPVDTNDAIVNELNAESNDLMARSLKSPALRQLESIVEKGNGFDFYRDGMDHFMAYDFGHSKYDEGVTNALTSEAVKINRANEQTIFAPVANGLGRCGIRTVGTIASIGAGILDFAGRIAFGKSKKDFDLMEGVAQGEDYVIDKWNEFLPVYQTGDQERIAREHPLDPSYLTSGASVATFIDNIGFTIGAAVGSGWLAKLGSKAMIGLSTAMTGDAILKVTSKEDYDSSRILPAALAAAGTVVGGAAGKVIKPFMRVQLGTIAAAEMSAIGEGGIEGVNAKKEFINEKFAFYDSMTNQRKAELKQQYDKTATEAANKAYNEVKLNGGTEEEARAAMLAAQQKAMAGYENDLAIIDWQGTKAKNQVLGESENVRNLTALLNIPILTASNYIQWGKVLSGGFKTNRSMVNIEMRAGAKEAGKAAYKDALNNAKDGAARRAVKANRANIENKAAMEWARANGGNLFDAPNPNLTVRDYAEIFLKHPMAEGSEEINQAAAANFSKGYYEWKTDNYYSQVSDLDTYRETESAWQAGMKGLVNTYFSESAWNEFLMGALTGLIGIPGWRGFRERTMNVYDQDGKALPEPNITEKRHYFPFVMRGGVYGEWKKMKQDKENAAKLADQLNKYITPENINRLQAAFNNLAKNAQYNKDKKVFVENGDKFNYQTAADKELVNALETFQNAGQMSLFKTLVHSLYDVKTAEDMIALQEQTTTTDADGVKHGPYSEFHIMELDENATDAQREANEEEMRKMREKIKENADHLVEAIDMYEKARYQLDWETKQGLTDSQLNCLTWYKVRLGLFDSRAKDMYTKTQSFLGDIMNNFDKLIETEEAEAEATIAALKDRLKDDKFGEEDKKKIQEQIEQTELGLKLYKEGAEGFRQRYEKARRESDPLKAVNILFAGNMRAKPIIDKKGRLDFIPFGRNKNQEKAFEEARLQYNIGFFIQELCRSIENAEGYSTANAVIASTILDNQDQLNEMASYIRDMHECVGRSLFFKDMYQSFKDNPTLMVKMEYQAQQDDAIKARQKEVDEATDEVSKSADSLPHLYDAVVKMILDGKDVNLISEAINKLAKEGNQAAKDFNVNQMFVRVFVNALDDVVADGIKGMELTYKAIIIQAVLDASRDAVGGEEILKLAQEKLNEIFKDKKSLQKYITDNKLASGDFANVDKFFSDDVAVVQRDAKGEIVRGPNKIPIRTLTGKDTLAILRETTPEILAAAKNKVAEKYKIYTAYSGGEHMTDEEIQAYNDKIKNATKGSLADFESKTLDVQHALTQIGPDAGEATDAQGTTTTQQGGTSTSQQGGTTTKQGGTTTTTTIQQASTKSDEIQAAEKEVEKWKDSINFLEYELQKEEDIAKNDSLPAEDRGASAQKVQQRRAELDIARQKLAEAQKKLDDLRQKDTNGQGSTNGQDGQQDGTSTDEELAKAQKELEELKRQQEELERQRKEAEEAAKKNPPQGDESNDDETDTETNTDDNTDTEEDTDTDVDEDEDTDTEEEEELTIEEEEEANKLDERIKEIEEELKDAESGESRHSLEAERDDLKKKSEELRKKAEEIRPQREKEWAERKERRKREKKQKAAEKRDKKETPREREERLRKLEEEIQRKIDEKMEEMERLEADKADEEAADAMEDTDIVVGDDDNINSNEAAVEEREKAETEQGKDKKSVWRPILSYFNLEFRKKFKRLVKNCRVKFVKGGVVECKEGEAGWCEAFWQTYKKLGIFSCLDDVEKGSPDAIRVGQEVFFLIDAVEVGKETSKYLGLTAEECQYNGKPIVWMVVKRKDGSLQAIGSLATNDKKLYEYDQTPLYEEMKARFEEGGGRAYMHYRSSSIEEIHTGYVALSKENNNLVNVYGSKYNAKFVVNVQSKKKMENGGLAIVAGGVEGVIADPQSLPSGRLNCLVKDNVNGQYIHYNCLVARYGKTLDAQNSRAWRAADDVIRNFLTEIYKSKTLEKAKKNATKFYIKLNKIVNLSGCGIHLSVRQNKETKQFYVVIGRQSKDSKLKTDKAGNVIKSKKGTALHVRQEKNFKLKGEADTISVDSFRKQLAGEEGLPFTIKTRELEAYNKKEDSADREKIANLVEDGIISVNIENGHDHLVGAHVDVSTELNETSEARREREKREAATYAEEKKDNVYSKEILGHEIEVDDRYHEVRVDGKTVKNKRTERLLKVIVNDEVLYDYVEDNTGGVLMSQIFVYNNKENKIEVLYCNNDGFVESPASHDEIHFFGDKGQFEDFCDIQKNLGELLVGYQNELGGFLSQLLKVAEGKGLNRFSQPAVFVACLMREIADDLKSIKKIIPLDKVFDLSAYLGSPFFDERYAPEGFSPYENDIEEFVGRIFYGLIKSEVFDVKNHKGFMGYVYAYEEEDGTRIYRDQDGREISQYGLFLKEKFLEKPTPDASEQPVATQQQPTSTPTAEEQQQPSPKPTPTTVTEEQQPQQPAPTTQETQQGEEQQPDPTVDPEQGTEEQGSEGGNISGSNISETVSEVNRKGRCFTLFEDDPFSIRKPTDEKAAKMNREREMAAVRRIFPSMTHDESVEFVDDLIEVGSKGLVAQGVFKNGRMVVSKNAVRGTLFHEAFHKIYRTALTEQVQKDLLDDVRRVMDNYGLNDFQAEEILCDWFRDYMVDQVYGKSWTQRIKDFFRRLFNLVRPGYEGLTSVTLDIFAEAQEGSYDRPRFEYKTVKQERIEEYNRLGLTYREMAILEDARNAYDARTAEEKSMLAEAGITRRMFNRLSPKSREDIIDCL